MLSNDDLVETASSIAAAQCSDGMIPWFAGGHADPWNHVEAAMALSATGFSDEAAAAYDWLAATQLGDGSWHTYYLEGGEVADERRDTNLACYVATGVWQHYLATGDIGFLAAARPMVEAAVSFVLSCRFSTGEVAWSIEPDGSPARFALLTASSSVVTSLRAATALHAKLGHDSPIGAQASTAASVLARCVEDAALGRPTGRFLAKDEYAMDWYYPVLAGVLEGCEAVDRLARRAGRFVVSGWGVRCQSHREWVTAAETAECAIAFARAGLAGDAATLLSFLSRHRRRDGSYLTGLVWPDGATFPTGEASTYSAAAVILAHDVLAAGPTAQALGITAGLEAAGDLPLRRPRGAAAPAGSR